MEVSSKTTKTLTNRIGWDLSPNRAVFLFVEFDLNLLQRGLAGSSYPVKAF
jgi:hypothetical protein